MVAEGLVSVVTPCLNAVRFVEETVRSVLSQGHRSIEHIVVDGGSSDGTLDVLDRSQSALRVVSEPAARQAAAVNLGWSLSRGEILGWLNADDTYLPGAIGRAAAYLASHPDVDGVYGDCDYVDEKGGFVRPYPAARFDLPQLVACVANPIPQPSIFLRRRLVQRLGGLDESLDCALDLDYWMRLGAAGARLDYLPERQARLRLHASAKSLDALDRFGVEIPQVYERFFARADLPPEVERLRPAALARAAERGAQCLFWSGRFSEARRYAWRAWRQSPRRLRTLYFTMGAPGRWIYERSRGNPFRFGL